MISKLFIFVFTALCFLTPGIYGQECVPTQVVYIYISADSLLFWEIHPEETCPIDEFIVEIEGDQDDRYRFRVRNTFVDVSFLPICELWQFVVTPVSNGVEGYPRRMIDHVPLPRDADLSLSYFELTHLSPRELLLEWDLTNRTHGDCSLRYRVVVEDQETGELYDTYVSGSWIILDHLSPCVSYEVSIRAINRAHPTIEGPRRYRLHDMVAHEQIAPTLNNVVMSATTADLQFNLEPFNSNRCPMRTLFVDAGSSFNISVPLQNAEGERPPAEVNLKGLRSDSMYLLKVSVQNSGGISPAAQFGVQTLPLNPGRK